MLPWLSYFASIAMNYCTAGKRFNVEVSNSKVALKVGTVNEGVICDSLPASVEMRTEIPHFNLGADWPPRLPG